MNANVSPCPLDVQKCNWLLTGHNMSMLCLHTKKKNKSINALMYQAPVLLAFFVLSHLSSTFHVNLVSKCMKRFYFLHYIVSLCNWWVFRISFRYLQTLSTTLKACFLLKHLFMWCVIGSHLVVFPEILVFLSRSGDKKKRPTKSLRSYLIDKMRIRFCSVGAHLCWGLGITF